LRRLVLPARQQQSTSQPQTTTRLTNLGPIVSAPRPVVQDVPPPGGFEPIRIKRNMPDKFWGAGTMLLVMAGIMGYGWYCYAKWYKRQIKVKMEKEQLQMAIMPFLNAERDIVYTIKKRAFMKKVRELMKDEEEFDVDERFYHSKKYFMYPRFALELDSFKGTGLLSEEVSTK
jgi:NADH dehydrogenase (ubiquinone) 1 alpha subcomplex subunit 13